MGQPYIKKTGGSSGGERGVNNEEDILETSQRKYNKERE